jgi:hypothetical protein
VPIKTKIKPTNSNNVKKYSINKLSPKKRKISLKYKILIIKITKIKEKITFNKKYVIKNKIIRIYTKF